MLTFLSISSFQLCTVCMTCGPMWTSDEINKDALIEESASWWVGGETAIANKRDTLWVEMPAFWFQFKY